MYYNYYATQVMLHYGGEEWVKWNNETKRYDYYDDPYEHAEYDDYYDDYEYHHNVYDYACGRNYY